MARLVQCPRGEVTELSASDLTDGIAWVHKGGSTAFITGSETSDEPTVAEMLERGIPYTLGRGENLDAMADLFRGETYVRLWAYAPDGAQFTVYDA